MLKILLRQRLEMLGVWFTGAMRKNKKQSKGKLIAFSLLMVYALGALGFLFWHIFDTLAQPFNMFGLDWLYFSLAAVMSFGLMFVGSVFTAKAQLYEARDNDLLLSMPIKPSHILLSRLFLLFVINFVLDMLVAVPGLLVCSQYGMLSAWGWAAYIILFLLLPLLTLAVGALFAWLLSLATARVQRKSLVTTLLSFAFLGLYMYFSMNMNNLLLSVAADASGLAGSLGAVAPVYWIGIAVADGSVPALLGAAAVMLGAFALMYALLSATFIKTATDKRGTRVRPAAEAASFGSARSALLRREIARFLNCPPYMLNAGLGSIMALAAAVLLIVKRADVMQLLAMIPESAELINALAVCALCVMASMALYTTPSVALEGKNIWIVQSLPVDCREVLRAKLRLHNIFSIPPVAAAAVAAAVLLKPSGIMLACFIVLPVLFCLFMGLFGLVENLRHPALDWTSETQAVKSGVGVMITMFGSWGLIAVPVLPVVLGAGLSATAVAAAFTLVVALLCAALYRLLMSWGVRRFMSL